MYLIPSLVIRKNLAFHTINHEINKYVGDPVNILKILSDFEVNEISIVLKDLDSILSVEAATPFLQRPVSVTGPIADHSIMDRLISCGVDRIGLKYCRSKKQLFNLFSIHYGRSTLVANIDCRTPDELNHEMFQEIISLSENVGEVIIHDISRSGLQSGLNDKIVKFVNKLSNFVDIRVSLEGGFKKEVGNLDTCSAIYYSTSFIFTDKNSMDFNNIMIRPL